MLPEKPDVEVYIRYVDDLASLKDDLNKREYEYEKKIASHIRDAMRRGAKTRELDFVKILGNSEQDTTELDALKSEIFDKKKAISILYGKIRAWEAQKDLYRTDSYHMVRGTMIPSDNEEGQED